MKCEKCNSEDKQIKAGKTRAGSQMYKCKICGKVYTPNKKEKCYNKEIKTVNKIVFAYCHSEG